MLQPPLMRIVNDSTILTPPDNARDQSQLKLQIYGKKRKKNQMLDKIDKASQTRWACWARLHDVFSPLEIRVAPALKIARNAFYENMEYSVQRTATLSEIKTGYRWIYAKPNIKSLRSFPCRRPGACFMIQRMVWVWCPLSETLMISRWFDHVVG